MTCQCFSDNSLGLTQISVCDARLIAGREMNSDDHSSKLQVTRKMLEKKNDNIRN